MKTILSLTHRCNQACRYCKAGNSRKSDMTLDMAKRCIDAALTCLPVDSQLYLGLFGGEPLLEKKRGQFLN
ncbi:MAG: 4Fe-4S cluster-binding domain-containing protein [Thermodesulfobacteriota bacterium]|nr:4Fe-4S cluster-binding domain-containing protein [Thermodesulfobacteriota bacterium]